MSARLSLSLTVALLLSMTAPTVGGEAVTQTFSAPLDRVWSTTEAVLKHLGWDIDRRDRSIGWITTESRRVEGEDYGVYAKGMRHRLTLHLKVEGSNRTTVSVERSVFKRERILWMDKDEPVTIKDHDVEKALLAAIGKSL